MSWSGGGSVLGLPSVSGGGGGFSVPTPPTPATVTRAPYAPNLTSGPSGKCPYRPWISTVIDGVLAFANGWDQPWYWDGGSNFYDLGSTVPTSFSGSADTATSTFLAGTTQTYRLAFYNSTLGKETAPQVETVTDGSNSYDVDLTWTDPGGEFDKARIYRRLQGSDAYKLVATVDASTAAYTDNSVDSAIETNEAYLRRFRETKPPVFNGILGHSGRLWGWKGATLYYSQVVDTGGEFLVDDFPSANILQVGVNDGHGDIVSVRAHYTSLFVFKRRAVYEIVGDDPSNFIIRRLFADRGAVSHRSVLSIEGTILFLDEQGLYSWVPGAEPLIAGATMGTRDSPLSPVWDRMNLDAADLFSAYHDEESGNYVVYVALDHELTPGHAVVYDYRRNRFVMDDARWGVAGGWLEDASGTQHICRVDDLGYLWEDRQSNTEGVFTGTMAGATTSVSETDLAASGASLDATIEGVPGSPIDLYDADGNVVSVNRVVGATSTDITFLYAETSADAAIVTSFSAGVIPAEFRTGKLTFGGDGKKHVERFIVEHEIESSATLRFDSAPDDEAFALQLEMDLSTEGRQIVDVDDRGWDWNLRGVLRQAGEDFAITALTVVFFTRMDRT